MFPFLVLEAKADIGSGGNTVLKTKLQSSLTILEVLRIQSELAEKSGMANRDDYQGSLAWFIAYRSEQWQVYVAFTETVKGQIEHVSIYTNHVILVLNVNISKESALDLERRPYQHGPCSWNDARC